MRRSKDERLSKKSSVRNKLGGNITEMTTARTSAKHIAASIKTESRPIAALQMKEEVLEHGIRVGKMEVDNDFKDIFLTATASAQ
jgi:hypothetical protein